MFDYKRPAYLESRVQRTILKHGLSISSVRWKRLGGGCVSKLMMLKPGFQPQSF